MYHIMDYTFNFCIEQDLLTITTVTSPYAKQENEYVEMRIYVYLEE